MVTFIVECGETDRDPPRRFTGALKNALDLTPIPALRDTPVGLVAMGGSHHHYLGAERHLRDVLSFFGALVLPTAVYLSSRDFTEGVPGDRAVSELDALLAAAVTLGPPPLAAGLDTPGRVCLPG